MRAIGLGILGFVLGAFAGFVATLTAAWVWFDILDMAGPDSGPKPGLDWLVTLGPVLMLGGGGAAAWWLVRRDRRGGSLVLPLVVGAIGLVPLGLFLGSLFGIG